MKGTSKDQQMADVARRLKNLAKELQIWVIALSQLNRDRDNPEPSIDRLRDSGQIAEAADTVILVYRPEYYGKNFPKPFHDMSTHNTALIDVCKGRNTGTMKFVCRFIPELTLFLDGDAGEIEKNESDEPF
jgi:replicative DNA helicase